MTPLPTYDRRHAAPVAPVPPVERPLPSPSIVRNRKRPIARTVALIVVAALIGGALVFAWDRTGSRDRSGALAVAVTQRDAAQDQVAVLNDRVEELQGRLTETSDLATGLEGRASAARAELLAMLGPALPDGRHFGEIYAVGHNQNPPRLVIDIEQWFTDQAAVDAAIADGINLDPGINGYYIRNENPRWRTIKIDPATGVTLKTYPFADPSQPTTITLGEFGALFTSYEGRLLPLSPYWITVVNGTIVAIEEQFIP